jgi:ribokinase
MPRIAVVGSLNMDLVVRAPHLPQAGQTLLGGPFAMFAGGKGANQAVAARRLGAEVTLIGAHGDDGFGKVLRAGLEADGVVLRLQEVAAPTGVALITTDAHGENTIVVAPGANAAVDPGVAAAELDAITVLGGFDCLVVQLEVPLPVVDAAVQCARRHGSKVVLNAAPARRLPDELLRAVDVLVVNRGEAALLVAAASDAAPAAGAETLAGALLAMGPTRVFVTLGREGAVACTRGGDGGTGAAPRILRQPGFRVDSIDAVAAGDAFVGAVAVALAEGMGEDASLRLACAAGALATTKRGAQPSLPRRAEVDAFLARQA